MKLRLSFSRQLLIAIILMFLPSLHMQGAVPVFKETTTLSGNGTESNPYIIDSKEALIYLQEQIAGDNFDTNGKFFKLAKDIDMRGSDDMNPIGGYKYTSDNKMFRGTFDGNGHAIIRSGSKEALFGYVTGTIKNLALIGENNMSPMMVYSLGVEGHGYKGTISNCYVGGSFELLSNVNAGICYEAYNGSVIENSYFKGSCTIYTEGTYKRYETEYFSGICNNCDNSTIKNCYASFSISEGDAVVYGICDVKASTNPTVTGCYAYVANRDVSTNLGMAEKFVNSELELNDCMKAPFEAGVYHPVLPSTKHYDNVRCSNDETHPSNVELSKLDAIPVDPDNNRIMRYEPADGEDYKNDVLLNRLPNLAVYDADTETDNISYCNLKPGVNFVYWPYTKNGELVYKKGTLCYPLTLTGNADTYMLCLPGTVKKENLPKGSRLMIVGSATERKNAVMANVLDCEYIPAGNSFLAYIPGEKGDVVRIKMEGDIATSTPDGNLQTISYNGISINTNLIGSFKNNWSVDKYQTFNKMGDNQILKSEEDSPKMPAFSAAFLLDSKNSWDAINLLDHLDLDEASDDVGNVLGFNRYKVANVKLKRSLKAGSWNTICLPFNVKKDEMTVFGGDDTSVEEIDDVANVGGVCTLRFKKATSIEAGKSYLIKQTAAYPDVLEWKLRTIDNEKKPGNFKVPRFDGFDTVTFTGSFAPTQLVGNSSKDSKFFIQGDRIYKVGDGQTVAMKGFRCWLTTNNAAALTSARIMHADGTTTDLRVVEVGSNADGSRIYDLQGIETAKPSKTGVYIKNGKKFVEK